MSTFKDMLSGTQPPDEVPNALNEELNEDLVNEITSVDPSPSPAASETPEAPKAQLPAGEANVILSAERLGDALGEGLTNIGTVGVMLPDPETQAGGFYVPQEKASVLVVQFPQYKFLVKKGQATPPVTIGA